MCRWAGSATTSNGLGWSPDTFWRSSLADYFLAVEAHNSITRGGVTPATREDLEELKRLYPDEPRKSGHGF